MRDLAQRFHGVDSIRLVSMASVRDLTLLPQASKKGTHFTHYVRLV